MKQLEQTLPINPSRLLLKCVLYVFTVILKGAIYW
jgi:hypothetical protein